MFKTNGDLLWEKDFLKEGNNGDASGKSVTIDKNGTIYHVGLTSSNLFGLSKGMADFYLVKLKLN